MRRFVLTLVSLALVLVGYAPVAEAGGARDYIVRYRETAVAGDAATVAHQTDIHVFKTTRKLRHWVPFGSERDAVCNAPRGC